MNKNNSILSTQGCSRRRHICCPEEIVTTQKRISEKSNLFTCLMLKRLYLIIFLSILKSVKIMPKTEFVMKLLLIFLDKILLKLLKNVDVHIIYCLLCLLVKNI